jgi:anti-anti-sigma regulatory factor
MSTLTPKSETEQIVEADIKARREQFALDFTKVMTRAAATLVVMVTILWLYSRAHTQLLIFAFLLAQIVVCMGAYPGFQRRGQAKAGIYLALFSLSFTATCGFVIFPQIALALLIGQVVTVVTASLILDRKESRSLIAIVVFLVAAGIVLAHVLSPHLFTPLDETLGVVANLFIVVVAFLTMGIMIRMITIEQEDFFREIRLAEESLKGAHAEAERLVEERTAALEQETSERERLQQEIIAAQRQALKELSTPIIPVMDRVLVMPLVGSIDSMRAKDIMRALLAGIREHHARVVILDITGVPIVDSGVASHLDKTIQAARLKGAQTIITGISEEVAEAIVDLGIDWSGVETLSDLQTGLRAALGSLGITLAVTH